MLRRPKRRLLDQPVTASLEDLIPAGHSYRHVGATLDLSFVRAWVADCYSCESGHFGIDPVVFLETHPTQ
jgi:hypothetical protein